MPSTVPPDAQPLPPAALRLWRVQVGAIVGFVALVCLVGGVVAVIAGEALFAAIALVVVGLLVAGWWVGTGWSFRSYRWQLTASTVELRRGVLIRRHEVLPRARVQNVTQTAGPLARSMGLATVMIHSAGARTPNVVIPDIPGEVAAALRAELLPQ